MLLYCSLIVVAGWVRETFVNRGKEVRGAG
jgi:hypothetical protein